MKRILVTGARALRRSIVLATLLSTVVLTFSASAQTHSDPSPKRYGRYHLFERVDLAANVGTFGALQTEQVFEFGLEARLAPWQVLDSVALRPVVGASLLDDGGNYWYVGARAEIDLDAQGDYSLGLSFAPGLYSPGGIDLGGPIEFRSGIDLNYEIFEGVTAGVGLFHLSNGGLYSRNRGSESLLFSLSTKL